jgi:hypothetical protein
MNLKRLERYLRVNLLGAGPRLMKKKINRTAVSRRVRDTDLEDSLKQCLQQVVDDIYLIKREIMEEFRINVNPGPMCKAEETGFTLKNKKHP